MEAQVSGLAIGMMALSLFAGVAIPVVMFVVLWKKFKCKAVPFFAGVATMFVAALLLEQILHTIVFMSPIGGAIRDNVWLYALYGAFCAAFFEECGRYIAMNKCLKNYHDDKRNGIMYGAGHGGFECLYLLGIGMLSNLTMAITINSGAISSVTADLKGDQLEQVMSLVNTLQTTGAGMYAVGLLERIFAVALQIIMSVFMWQAAAKGKKLFFGVAFAIHFVADFAAVIVSNFFGIAATECVFAVIVVAGSFFASKVYTRED